MSIDFGALLSGGNSIVQAQKGLRASVQHSRIGDKWEDIVLKREGVYLASQAMRIEFDDTNPSEESSDAGIGFMSRGVIFGIKDHPTLPDLDIEPWDTFVLGKDEFTIMTVNYTLIGQIQAQFEAVGG